MYRIALLLSFICFASFVYAQTRTDAELSKILMNSKSPLMKNVIANKDTFRLQIIYTQIDRDKNNNPVFRHLHFNVDRDLYFNPASTVKLPLALLALEKLNEINIKGVDKYTAMQIDSTYEGQVTAYYDSTSETNYPSIAHYIRKALLVSDNDAYNRLYQFVGQKTVKQRLAAMGFEGTRINRQFMGFSDEQNRHTNQIRFIDKSGNVIYTQPPAYNDDPYIYGKPVFMGRGHLNRNDSLILKPIDFTKANDVPLAELQRILQSVMFPESLPSDKRWNFTEDDFEFMYRYLSQYPSETSYPKYDTSQYYDSYVKFYFRGKHRMPEGVRVFNKVGWAYGFLTDVSYVANFNNGVEFMLTATLYVNSDGILNDNKYEYKSVGWPFLYELGQTIYKYELNRRRSRKPDLSRFKVKYEKRDPRDMRPSLKDIDN